MYTTGNRAEEDVRSGRPVHFYQTKSSYGIGWGEITAIGIDSFTLLNGPVQGIRPGALGYDKYGRIRLGLRGTWAVTDTLDLRGLATSLWTAEAVDTRSTISSDGCPRDVRGCAGLTPRGPGRVSRGTDRYLGTEVDVGFDWHFAPNVSFLWTYAHLFAGGALRHASPAGLPGRVHDADSATAVVRYARSSRLGGELRPPSEPPPSGCAGKAGARTEVTPTRSWPADSGGRASRPAACRAACDRLPRMASLEQLRSIAALAGYAWTDEELRAIAPLVERSLALVERLESLPLRDVEPGIVFRIG